MLIIDPMKLVLKRDDIHYMLELVKRLPIRQRIVIEERFGLSGCKPKTLSEIAEVLNVSSAYVGDLLQRALKSLKEKMKGETQDEIYTRREQTKNNS